MKSYSVTATRGGRTFAARQAERRPREAAHAATPDYIECDRRQRAAALIERGQTEAFYRAMLADKPHDQLNGDDRLIGGVGDDTLLGEDGADTLIGGEGSSQLRPVPATAYRARIVLRATGGSMAA